MAHKGKDWPLTLRRDFNLNVFTYQHGLPKTWHLHWGQFFLLPGFLLDNTDWLCHEGPMPNEHTLLWRSVFTPFFPFLIRARVELAISGVPAGASRRIYLEDAIAGDVMVVRWDTDGTQYSWLSDTQLHSELLFWAPGFFFLRPVGWFPTIAPESY